MSFTARNNLIKFVNPGMPYCNFRNSTNKCNYFFFDVALFIDVGVHVLYKIYERIQCYSAEFSTKYNTTSIKVAQIFYSK